MPGVSDVSIGDRGTSFGCIDGGVIGSKASLLSGEVTVLSTLFGPLASPRGAPGGVDGMLMVAVLRVSGLTVGVSATLPLTTGLSSFGREIIEPLPSKSPIAASPAQQSEMNFDALCREPVAACSLASACLRAANAWFARAVSFAR